MAASAPPPPTYDESVGNKRFESSTPLNPPYPSGQPPYPQPTPVPANYGAASYPYQSVSPQPYETTTG